MNVRILMIMTGFSSLFIGSVLLLPAFMASREATHQIMAFLLPAVLAFTMGIGFIRYGKGYKERLLVREGALLMLLIWTSFIAIGMLPYIIAGRLSPFDAFCESVSGFTTTGLTLLSPYETRPIIFWRSITQWLGGLNIIMMVVTLMPQTGSEFAMKLVLPPNMSFGHILHSLRRLANGVLVVYFLFTGLAFVACYCCGINWFDAINVALVTLATGGCYDSPAVTGFTNSALEITVMVFMLLSSGNFLLYWQAMRRRSILDVLRSREMLAFLGLFSLFGSIISIHLWQSGIYDLAASIRFGFFETASFISTTGFSTARFPFWPDLDRHLLFLLVFVGGCIGSSAGGFKVLRFMILFKAAAKELRRMMHPHMVVNIFIGKHPVPGAVVGSTLVFFFLYMAVFFGFSLLVSLEGITDIKCLGIVASCLGNIGSAALLAENAASFASLSAGTRLLCCFLMLLGRIEIFSILMVVQLFIGRARQRW